MSSRDRRAVQYLRMSTERQDYSLTWQAAAIEAYAARAGYEIVGSFRDEGVSGLGIEGRQGLKDLLAAVLTGSPTFSIILVYDVSRWGRFQNPDQAAHYEFMCREAGVGIEYCAEGFSNDASPISALLKHVKRAMAAEYSRELSAKVRQAQMGLKKAGYWMGASPGFGLRREAVALNGRSLGLLEVGQYNAYPSAHTRLTPGPPDEVATVRRAFALYLRPGASFASVARSLNGEGRAGLNARPWTAARCRQLLLNVRYAGDYLINIRRTELGVTRRLPASALETVTGALPAIVDRRTFDAVQRKIARRSAKVTRAQVLDDLRRVFRERGTLSHHTLRLHGKWTPRVYTSRLGEIDSLYALCGAERPATHRDANLEAARRARCERGMTHSEADLLDRLRSLQARAGFLTARLIDADPATPISRTYQIRFGSLSRAYQLIGYQPMNGRQAAAIAAPPRQAQ